MTDQMPTASVGGGGHLRIRLDLAYDGAPFAGWAMQPGLVTVEGVLEKALAMLFRRRIRLTVAGRTDAGVHARGQVAHIDLLRSEWEAVSRGRAVPPGEALVRRLGGAVGRELSDQLTGRGRSVKNSLPAVVVTGAAVAPEGFDARFSALWRRYGYRIADEQVARDPLARHSTLWYPGRLDLDQLNVAAASLEGLRDFRAFCKPRAGATTVRELQRYEYHRGADGVLDVVIQADAFCHNMVRALIGSTLRVSSGDAPLEWLHERLTSGVKDARSVLAPPHPLVLEEVAYPGEDHVAQRAALTRARRAAPATRGKSPTSTGYQEA